MNHPIDDSSGTVAAYAVGNALGTTTTEVAGALEAGRTGLAPCALDLPFETATGSLPEGLPALPSSLRAWESRVARIAALVFQEVAPSVERAVRRWGGDRIAVVMGTSTGGILETEGALAALTDRGSLPPDWDLHRQHSFHGLLEVVRALAGARGPAWVVSTACSSSAKVLGSARRLLRCGLADAVLVGGADSLCLTTLRGFGSLQALSARPCRPFAADRDGTSIGEGAAFMLLERRGDGPARLLGVGESSDAHHMSHPHPEGVGAIAAMTEALAQARIDGSAVDYVNAHGTATPANDVVEALAIERVIGDRAAVASTKGFTGHMLGAAGMTEAVFAVMAMERSFVPESLGAAPLDPAVRLDIVRAARRMRVRHALSNSFAFGGNNASVVFGAA
jgi:3-oxoacyl-[acyl-carrier-protein] synthase-1